MKPNKLITGIAGCMLVGLLAGCGGSSKESGQAQTANPETQPEAEEALFTRICDRVKALIAQKDFETASQTLEVFKSYKLTPEQQKIVDGFKAQIAAGK